MNGTFLNFLEIFIDKDEFEISACDYVDKNWYNNLKNTYNNLQFLKDSENSLVYVWAKDFSSSIYLGNNKIKKVIVSKYKNANLIARIIECCINNLFRQNNYHTYLEKYSSSNIVVNNKQLFLGNKDLLVNRSISFNISFVNINQEIKFYIVLDTRLNKKFLIGANEAIKKGINIEQRWIKDDKIIANEHSILRYLQNKGLEKEFTSLIKEQTSENMSYKVIKKTLNFIKDNLQNKKLNSFSISFSNLTNLPYSSSFFNIEQLQSPKRYFFEDKPQMDNRFYQNNLKDLKPTSYGSLNQKIKIAVIVPASYLGITEEFLLKLKNNIKLLMHIPDIDYEILKCFSNSYDDYKKALDDNINSLNNVQMAIIIVSEEMKSLKVQESPYFYCKAKFLGRGISTQEIRVESIKRLNDFILNNITLNIYAKIGGTPWTIESIGGIKDEYIFGISSSSDFDKTKIIGFANVFNYSGAYCTGDCTSLCNVSEYKSNFKCIIKKQMDQIIKSESKQVRLIFHLFKSPSNDIEIAALQEIINEYKDIDIDYCFIKASFIHNYRLFENEGLDNVKSGKCIFISNNQALVSFTKNIPAYIVVDKRSTFNDLYYICKQIYYFSHLSVRGFKPSYKSVTLLYPQLMMRLLVKLKEIPGWDYDSLKSIEDKLWFV